MLASTLTPKEQTTIPAEIESFDYQYHRALQDVLSEWDSPADDEAYHNLGTPHV